MMRKLLATTAAVVFSMLYQVHAKGYVTRCFFEGNSVMPSFSYDFGSGNIHDITCSDYCSCDGSRTGYNGCQKCCCSKAQKKTSVKGKEAAIILVSLLAFLLTISDLQRPGSNFFSCHFTISKSYGKDRCQNFCY